MNASDNDTISIVRDVLAKQRKCWLPCNCVESPQLDSCGKCAAEIVAAIPNRAVTMPEMSREDADKLRAAWDANEGGGRKIIEGLKDAVAGDFSRVTIEGVTWVRADRASGVLQDDLRDMLVALGLPPDHPRPRSPHEVFRECIEEVKRIRTERKP